jgi:hypothetical protein
MMALHRQRRIWCGVASAIFAAMLLLSMSLNWFANKGLRVSLPTSLPTSVSFTDGQVLARRSVKWEVPRSRSGPHLSLRIIDGRRRHGLPWHPAHRYHVNSSGTMASHTVNMPLWPPGITAAALAAWCARGVRWRCRGVVCSRCGYDLAGLPAETLCPECGGSQTLDRRVRLLRRLPRLSIALVAGCFTLSCLLCIGLNLIDHHISHSRSDRTQYIVIAHGQVSIQSWSRDVISGRYPDDPTIDGGFSFRRSGRREAWRWLPHYTRLSDTGPTWNGYYGFYFAIPLWMPTLLAAVIAFWAGRGPRPRLSGPTGGRLNG